MAEKFYFVEALDSGVWRHHDQLIIALVDAKWCIDGKGVDVLPGVVYPFARDEDANYFLTLHENERGGAPRAMPLVVEKGAMVTFWRESDAAYFVEKGKARHLTDAEVAAAFAAANGEPVPEPAREPARDVSDAGPNHEDTAVPSAPKTRKKKAATA